MPNKLSRVFDLALSIARLPVARLEFRQALNPDDVGKMHKYFTKRHPKYFVFQNKSLGAALVDLTKFRDRERVYGHHQGAQFVPEHHARKAQAKGYRVVEIDRNDYIDDIHDINNSVEIRQGRPMDATYREKMTRYPTDKNYTYFGVLNATGKLMAYGDLGLYGNFARVQPGYRRPEQRRHDAPDGDGNNLPA